MRSAASGSSVASPSGVSRPATRIRTGEPSCRCTSLAPRSIARRRIASKRARSASVERGEIGRAPDRLRARGGRGVGAAAARASAASRRRSGAVGVGGCRRAVRGAARAPAARRAPRAGAAFAFCFAITCCCAAISFASWPRSMKPRATRISPSLASSPARPWARTASASWSMLIIFRWTASRPSSGTGFGSVIDPLSAARRPE